MPGLQGQLLAARKFIVHCVHNVHFVHHKKTPRNPRGVWAMCILLCCSLKWHITVRDVSGQGLVRFVVSGMSLG
jgi:hypothetical protein